ncbi:Coenzyme F420 hydrogenase/dehydrogenase, beta subunit C-terminal domain [Akkermansiaceae bacterium]|nr:Coenzyme F420 hydrogenase/dehydrogenase, beta subunit C-terminal domain [Akkermansiaceae bacterium]
MYRPTLPKTEESASQAAKVCPFTSAGGNEDQLAAERFPDAKSDSEIGRYYDLRVGHVTNPNTRNLSSSGGIITWLLQSLLEEDLVDYVVHIREGDAEAMYRYGISETSEEVQRGAKSRYYPVELSQVIEKIRERNGVTVVVALPCFAKALRRMMKIDESLAKKIRFIVGVVCGHLKSSRYADFLASQLGVDPSEDKQVDFRVKFPDGAASGYGFSVKADGKEEVRRMGTLFGNSWGLNLFRYPACDFCDDVFAECADFAVGDAWLPQYLPDPAGNSIMVIRDSLLSELVDQASLSGELKVDQASLEDIKRSQAGGLRDRREGLQYRLALKEKENSWAPKKRVKARVDHLDRHRRKIYSLRSDLGNASHQLWQEALRKDGFETFRKNVSPKAHQIMDLYRPLWKRPLVKLKRALSSLSSSK